VAVFVYSLASPRFLPPAGSYSVYENRKNTHTEFPGWQLTCELKNAVEDSMDVF
jgi:hypothetical protein